MLTHREPSKAATVPLREDRHFQRFPLFSRCSPRFFIFAAVMLDFSLNFHDRYQQLTGNSAVIEEQRNNSGGTATITAAEQRGSAGNSGPVRMATPPS
ncbi:hypothetical protein ABC974_03750 [Sphingomonas oligophenolica]|uniref:Uncharacterized protein n=1 Tax=Sphingomonas oligophenolica TaxID=301154 RepID=A0ABU9XYT7_9SPHN